MENKKIVPINAIPLTDAKEFILSYNYKLPSTEEEIYNLTSNIIATSTINSAPTTIVDYIIALNLSTNLSNNGISKQSASKILMASENSLVPLSQSLALSHVDKERMIRILGYMNLLDNDISLLDNLPDDTLANILENLDCKSTFLICKLSNRLSNFCKNEVIKDQGFVTNPSGYLERIISRNNLEVTLNNKFSEEGLTVKNYSLPQLEFVCNMRNRQIPTMTSLDNILFILMDNDIYMVTLSNDQDIQIEKLNIDRLPKIIQILHHDNKLLALTLDGHIHIIGGDVRFFNGIAISHKKVSGIDNVVFMIPESNFSVIRSNGDVFDVIIKNNGDAITKRIDILKDIVDESIGLGLPLILKNNKEVYIERLQQLEHIDNITDAISISAGDHYYLVATVDGSVYSWGNNDFGQLGLGDQEPRETAEQIPNLNNIVQVLADDGISLALNNVGEIYKFGRGFDDVDIVPINLPDINDVVELYQTNNYKSKNYDNDDYDIDQLYEFDKEVFNFQIARTNTGEYMVLLVGEYYDSFTLF